MIDCKDCLHFRSFPGDTPWKRKTGCYHLDHMDQKHGEGFLAEQCIPGNHEKINLRGDCAQFEQRVGRGSLLQRFLQAMRA